MTKSFILRPWEMEDIENLAKFANNPNIARYLTDRFPHPYTERDGEKFIKMTKEHDPVQIFAIEVDGRAAGGIGLHPNIDIYRRNMELGYWLAEPFWGRGIMTETIKRMVRYGFKTFDIDRIYARPFGSNIASHRVLLKAGFTLEARFEKTLIKNGIYEDELIFAVRNRTRQSNEVV